MLNKPSLNCQLKKETKCIFRFEWQSPLIGVPYSMENTQKYNT